LKITGRVAMVRQEVLDLVDAEMANMIADENLK